MLETLNLTHKWAGDCGGGRVGWEIYQGEEYIGLLMVSVFLGQETWSICHDGLSTYDLASKDAALRCLLVKHRAAQEKMQKPATGEEE